MRRLVSWPRPAGWHARVAAFAVAAVAAGAVGCQGEPSMLCDTMRVVWPFFSLDPSLDTSPDEGLQIDLELRSTILPGTPVFLTVQGEREDPVPHPEPAIAAENGDLLFIAVNIPFGRVRLQLSADNQCGRVRSVRTPYVWDGLGFPTCEMDIGVEPAVVEELVPLGVLRAEHDADADTPGIQLQVAVAAGRPDMQVSFFALDPASGDQEILRQDTGGDLSAEFAITLGEGVQSLRAVCIWEPAGLRPSTPTLRLWVDTLVPDCALVAPTGPVDAADDLDLERAGVQFEVRGSSEADDVPGQPGLFTVQGAEFEGSAVDGDGTSSTTATIFLDPPGAAQVLSFRTRDAAGNQCEDTVTFE